MQRRDLLAGVGRGAAALALASLFGCRSRDAVRVEPLPPDGREPFSLGVASGMPTPASVVLWTRLAPRPREPLGGLPERPVAVQWDLAADERFARGLRSGTVLARPEHAHSVHVEVQGLASDRPWYYRFRCGDAVSPTGRTRTAPAPDAAVGRLRIALASCQHYEQGAFALQREIARHDVDLVLFVGDYIYESSRPRDRLRAHEGPAPVDLAGYRQRHATYKLDADLQAAHAAHPWLPTWDDHEVENDYAGGASVRERSAADFLRLRAAAYKAYFEHMPVSPRLAPRGPSMRIHAHHAWGRLADLWTLDNRQYRSAQPCNAEGRAGGRMLTHCGALDADAASMFGRRQERWLAAGLAASRRDWRLLAQATQIAPGGVATPFGRSVYSDSWDGYPAARARLLRAIAAHPQGDVVCLGGDLHRHAVAQLRADALDADAPVVASEFVCSSLTSRGVSAASNALVRASNPDLLHARGDERGYMLLELTPERLVCELRGTAHPVQADSVSLRQARYVVERGRPGPERDA